MSKKNKLSIQIVVYVFLIVMALIFVVPLIWTFLSAFKVDMEINKAGGYMFFPKTWTLKNFAEILSKGNKQLPVYRWFANSLLVSGIHTALAVTIFSLAAFGYAKLNLKGGNMIFLAMLFLSSFPAVVNIVPMYKIMHTIGWINKAPALIFPGLAGMYNIFLIRQFMYSIPDSLLESAKIDGANEAVIFAKITIPLVKPILVAVGLFCFTANWNDFLWPSIAINNIDKLTLTPGLQLAKGVYGAQVARMSAVAAIAIAPMIVLFAFTQKYFMSGISISSGVKG